LIKTGDIERVNHTPKNLKDSLGVIGVMVNCLVASMINVCAEGEGPNGS
jgi:hypothetical protein